jgi:hypothetical protein
MAVDITSRELDYRGFADWQMREEVPELICNPLQENAAWIFV